MKNDIFGVLASLFGGGSLAATARYLADLGRDDSPIVLNRWLRHAFSGGAIGVFAGLGYEYFDLSGNVIHGLVGATVFFIRDIMNAVPLILGKFIDKKIK